MTTGRRPYMDMDRTPAKLGIGTVAGGAHRIQVQFFNGLNMALALISHRRNQACYR